jgi:hypothetical protein
MADTFISAQEAARRTGLSTGALAKRRYLKKAPTAGSTSRRTPSCTRKVKWSASSPNAERPNTRSGARPCSAGAAAEIPDERPHPPTRDAALKLRQSFRDEVNATPGVPTFRAFIAEHLEVCARLAPKTLATYPTIVDSRSVPSSATSPHRDPLVRRRWLHGAHAEGVQPGLRERVRSHFSKRSSDTR